MRNKSISSIHRISSLLSFKPFQPFHDTTKNTGGNILEKAENDLA